SAASSSTTRTIAAARSASLFMGSSLVCVPGHRASTEVQADYLDQILRNSRRELRPPRGTWWGPCRARTRSTKETLDAAYRCDVVVDMGDGRWSPGSPLGLGTAAGTRRVARAPTTRSGRERGDRGTLPASRSRRDHDRRVRPTATKDPGRLSAMTPPSLQKDCTCEEYFPPYRVHRRSRRSSADTRGMRQPHHPD